MMCRLYTRRLGLILAAVAILQWPFECAGAERMWLICEKDQTSLELVGSDGSSLEVLESGKAAQGYSYGVAPHYVAFCYRQDGFAVNIYRRQSRERLIQTQLDTSYIIPRGDNHNSLMVVESQATPCVLLTGLHHTFAEKEEPLVLRDGTVAKADGKPIMQRASHIQIFLQRIDIVSGSIEQAPLPKQMGIPRLLNDGEHVYAVSETGAGYCTIQTRGALVIGPFTEMPGFPRSDINGGVVIITDPLRGSDTPMRVITSSGALAAFYGSSSAPKERAVDIQIPKSCVMPEVIRYARGEALLVGGRAAMPSTNALVVTGLRLFSFDAHTIPLADIELKMPLAKFQYNGTEDEVYGISADGHAIVRIDLTSGDIGQTLRVADNVRISDIVAVDASSPQSK